jgi:hypothetical protein
MGLSRMTVVRGWRASWLRRTGPTTEADTPRRRFYMGGTGELKTPKGVPLVGRAARPWGFAVFVAIM